MSHGEMGQQLSTQDGLPEGPGSISNTHMAAYKKPSSGVRGHTKMVHIHMWAKHIKYYFKQK